MTEPATRPAPHVVISGWYGQENVGDEAMLAVLLAAIERRRPDARFTVLSERPERIAAVHGRADRLVALPHPAPYGWPHALDFDLWRRTRAIRRAVRSASLFVLGGGSLLRDRGARNYLRLVDELWFAERARVPSAVVGVSIGPLQRAWGRALARRLLSRTTLLSVRDSESLGALDGIGVAPDKARCDGDLTLALEPAPRSASSAPAPILVAPCRAMLTGLHDGAAGNPKLDRVLAETLDALVERTNARVQFVPFRCAPDEDDAELCERIRAAMKRADRAEVLPHELDAAAVKARFARASLVIAARFHAVHFAVHSGTPTIAIAYGPKVDRLMGDVVLSDFSLAPGQASAAAMLELHARLAGSDADAPRAAKERLERDSSRTRSMLDELAALADR